MRKKLTSLLSNSAIWLAIGLLVSVPPLFRNALEYSLPTGYAGMFSLMAELIVKNDFRLPMDVPYYGPGGIPFAYPPLGLYGLAFLMKITGKTLVLLRFFPPLFAWLALIPFYLLVLEISKSKPAAMAAVVLASASVPLYVPHVWAAGIVRAPAFGFSLAAVLFFTRAADKRAWRDIFLGGISLGLALLTHFSYALFVAFWICFWVLTHSRWPTWLAALSVGLLGGLFASPWVGLMFFRYGASVFAGALNSHGNTAFLSTITSPVGMFSRLYEGLQPILENVLLTALIGIGIVAQVVRKSPALPIMFLFSAFLFQDDGQRFIYTLAIILASMGIAEAVNLLVNFLRRKRRLFALGVTVLVLLTVTQLWLDGVRIIENFSPRLTSAALDLADFIQQHTHPNATYLAMVPQDEAEWMPYLFRREPLIAQWGSEWLGRYNEQVELMLAARTCQTTQDLECLKGFFAKIQREPDYLIVLRKDGSLNRSLASEVSWTRVYENSRYVIWQNHHSCCWPTQHEDAGLAWTSTLDCICRLPRRQIHH